MDEKINVEDDTIALEAMFDILDQVSNNKDTRIEYCALYRKDKEKKK